MAAFFSLITVLTTLNMVSKYRSEVLMSLSKCFHVDTWFSSSLVCVLPQNVEVVQSLGTNSSKSCRLKF